MVIYHYVRNAVVCAIFEIKRQYNMEEIRRIIQILEPEI